MSAGRGFTFFSGNFTNQDGADLVSGCQSVDADIANDLAAWKQKITQLMIMLIAELLDVKENFMWPFNLHEIFLKEQKLTALSHLYEAETLDDLVKLAKLYQNDIFVTAGINSKKTSEFINSIIMTCDKPVDTLLRLNN